MIAPRFCVVFPFCCADDRDSRELAPLVVKWRVIPGSKAGIRAGKPFAVSGDPCSSARSHERALHVNLTVLLGTSSNPQSVRLGLGLIHGDARVGPLPIVDSRGIFVDNRGIEQYAQTVRPVARNTRSLDSENYRE
jgi:hypothetical protein